MSLSIFTLFIGFSPLKYKFKYFGDLVYSKYFTEIGLHAKTQQRAVKYFSSANNASSEKFNENNYGASLSLPLKWNRGSFNFLFRPEAGYTYHTTTNYKKSPIPRDNLNFGSINSGFVISAKQTRAVQHIYSRFGIELNPEYQRSLKEEVRAERINTKGALFLPGVIRNHGIKIDAAWQKELRNKNYEFEDYFAYSRGYEQVPNDEAYKFSFNYSFPLLYPDWGFGGITYFKRIRANLFYDMSLIKNSSKEYNQDSYGAELFFDNTALNLLPFSLCLRESFLIDKDVLNPKRKNKFELLFETRLN